LRGAADLEMLVVAGALDQLMVELLALGAVGVAGDFLRHVGAERVAAPFDAGGSPSPGQIGDGFGHRLDRRLPGRYLR
jgi:hypothetical protein